MKSKVVSTLFILFLYILIDYIFFKLTTYIGNMLVFSIIAFLLGSVLVFLLFETWIYKKFFDLKSRKIVILAFTLFPLVFSMIVADRLQSINRFYYNSKSVAKRNSGNLWQYDHFLGHKAIPGTHGSYDYYIGDSTRGSIPVYFDSMGFRTVLAPLKLKSKIMDLYLGCSVTFGDYIEAEESYPYLTSKLLGHNYINAAASGYGFGQMIQLSDQLLKMHPFKYVFIQLSPWLSERAMELNFTTPYIYRPFPYFSDNGNGFVLNPGAFSISEYSKRNWRNSKPSYLEKIQFFFTEGVSTEIYNYYSFQISRLKVFLGLLPKPTRRKSDLEKYFYDHVINMCKKYNAVPVILKYRYPSDECSILLRYLSSKAQVIDLDSVLEKEAVETGKPAGKLFSIYHVSIKDTIIYDNHPNRFANKLFSAKISGELQPTEKKENN